MNRVVSFAITFGTRVLSMDLNVQYIIGRPANEQSFSSEHELWILIAPPTISNMRKIRIKFFIING